jgi:hypothetical protein
MASSYTRACKEVFGQSSAQLIGKTVVLAVDITLRP